MTHEIELRVIIRSHSRGDCVPNFVVVRYELASSNECP